MNFSEQTPAPGARITFDIPLQSIESALIEFGHQANLSLLIRNDLDDNVRVGLDGEYAPLDALAVLLGHTELDYWSTDAGIIVYQPLARTHAGPLMASTDAAPVRTAPWFARLGVALAGIVLSGAALAQEPGDGARDDAGAVEEVVVTGIRSSLRASLDRKRDADNFVDAITAEDIGDFPDQNLAESLQRVSGVAIDRNYGEGSFASIRGLGPQFVLVTSNGRTVTSNVDVQASGDTELSQNNGSRLVGFDKFQSGLVQAVEVYKSPQADLSEGGLGGVINMQTRRPLHIGQRVTSFSALSAISQLADSTDPSLFGLFSDSYADDTIGFMVSAQWDDRSVRQDQFDTTRYDPRSLDVDRDGTDETIGYLVNNIRGAYFGEDRERLNVSTALQWRPADGIDLTFDVLYTEFNTEGTIIRLPLRTETQIATQVVSAAVETDNGQNLITFMETNGARPRPFPYLLQNDTEGLTIGGKLDFQATEQLTVDVDIALAKNETTGHSDWGFYDTGPTFVSYDIRGGRYKPLITIGKDITDPTQFSNTLVGQTDNESTDEELQFHADATYNFEHVLFDSVKAGLAYKDRQRDDVSRGFSTSVFSGEPMSGIGAIPFPANDFFTGISTTFPNSWVVPNIAAAAQQFFVERRDEIPDNSLASLQNEVQSGDIRFTEETLAVYVMFELSGELGATPYTGNFGVRYVETDTTAKGLITTVLGFNQTPGSTLSTIIFGDPLLTDVSNSYSELLPSFNLRFELRDDLLLRVAGAKVLSRPSFSQTNPSQSASAVLRTISSGNAALDPVTAWQADLALEWYFSEYAIVSLAPFGKWVDGFIATDTTTRTFPDIDPETNQPVVFRVNQPLNGDGAFVGGVEFNYQQTFPGLPSPFDGLGIQVNYTYVHTDADFVHPFTGASYGVPGMSENTYNVSAFYEKGRIGARIAFNQRDEFLSTLNDSGGNPLFIDENRSLDAGVSFRVRENVMLTLEGINLTDENVNMYNLLGTAERRMFAKEINSGRRFMAGVRVRF